MDWAEELKMSIRKTTARKGRRSKSRDPLKESGNSNTVTPTTKSNSTTQDLAIDNAMDVPQVPLTDATIPTTDSTTTTSVGDTTLFSSANSDSKQSSTLRRISGGWADVNTTKNSRLKRESFNDNDRIQPGFKLSATASSSDSIPVIPDLDDIKDDMLLSEIAEPPSIAIDRVFSLKELNSDLLSQNAFSAIENVDLSILTSCLEPQEALDEADEVWEWEKLFTEVIAEINSEKSNDRLSVRTFESPRPLDELMSAAMHL